MNLLAKLLQLRRYTVLCYGLAVLSTLVALYVRIFLGSSFVGYPFLTFFLAVLVSSLVGGLGPGIVAAVCSWLLAQYMLIEPIHSLRFLDASNWIALGVFACTCAIMIGLVHGLTLAYQGQVRAQVQLADLNRTLEQRVVARTAELEAEVERRLAMQDQLRHLQKMEAMGQLTGGIAHDFNNMLAIIIGSLDMVKRHAGNQGDARTIRYIGSALDGAQRAATLTSRLTAFSRQTPLSPQRWISTRWFAACWTCWAAC